jgi:hypothetical protein
MSSVSSDAAAQAALRGWWWLSSRRELRSNTSPPRVRSQGHISHIGFHGVGGFSVWQLGHTMTNAPMLDRCRQPRGKHRGAKDRRSAPGLCF